MSMTDTQPHGLRVLGRTRLSRSSEESTSIERQREIIESWASTHGHEIVGWADDVGVSGSVDPFDTPALGPWLTDERVGDWDILCSWKMDRLARRTIPLHKLMGWTQDHEKTLVCVADNIDLSTWVGRLVASVIAGVAEGELEAIRERNTASHKKLRQVGRWTGGRPPYGYRAVPSETGVCMVLEIDPETSAVVAEMIESVLDGRAPTAIAEELTGRGVPTPADRHELDRGRESKGRAWTSVGVFGILRSQALLGRTVYNGTVLRDENGAPVLQAPALVDSETFGKLQEALDAREGHRGPRHRSPLNKVAVCWTCDKPLYLRKNKKYKSNPDQPDEYYLLYHCKDKCHPQCNGDALIEMTYDHFVDTLGEQEVLEKRVTRAVDNSARMAEVEGAITELAEVMRSMSSAAGAKRIADQIHALDGELAQLESEHSSEAKVDWVGTGERYGDLWNAADADGKRELMIAAGIKVRAKPQMIGSKSGRGTVQIDFIIPEDLRERLKLPSDWVPDWERNRPSIDELDISEDAKEALKRP